MTKGLDLSHYNGKQDFEKLKAQGFEFCYFKATEGLSYVDPTFLGNVRAASAAGILTGAYHFFRPSVDGTDQARHFLSTTALLPLNLPHMLDWEVTDSVRASIQKVRATSWLENVKAVTGKIPGIYGSPGFLEPLGLDDSFKNYPLWVAHYGVNRPRIPSPWGDYMYWQYTDANGLDVDVFNGVF